MADGLTLLGCSGSVGGASAFAPTSISSLIVWLTPSVGCFKDAGVTPCVDGDTIQQLNDQSGNGNNASQSSAGSRPTFKTNIVNGKPVIRNNGSTWLVGASVWPSNADYTALVVYNPSNLAAGANNVWSGDSNVVANHALYIPTGGGGPVVYQHGSTGVQSSVSVGTSAWSVSQAYVNYQTDSAAGTLAGFHVLTNGAWAGMGTYTTDSFTAADTSNALGSFLNGPTFGFTGDIAAAFLFNGVITASNTNSMNAYLNSTYGLTLPTNFTINLVFDGDSITRGYRGSPGFAQVVAGATSGAYPINVGESSQTLQEMSVAYPTRVAPLFAAVSKNIIVLFAGTNDIFFGASGATTYTYFQSYCAAAKASGYKIVAVPMLPRGASLETERLAYNALIAADTTVDVKVSTTCDGGGVFAMWAPGANTNATYYDADNVHPSTAGHAVIATCIQSAIGTL